MTTIVYVDNGPDGFARVRNVSPGEAIQLELEAIADVTPEDLRIIAGFGLELAFAHRHPAPSRAYEAEVDRHGIEALGPERDAGATEWESATVARFASYFAGAPEADPS